jgi:hypothetical protein
MSGDFFRSRMDARYVGPENQRVPVELHEGHYTEFLRRYERRAAKAASQGLKAIAEIAPTLLKWIADARNIRVAIDRVIQNGGVPGPDNLDCSVLSNTEKWELARALKHSLVTGAYEHRPTRRIRIRKLSGSGYCIINIESHIDRIVARAILQVLQPLMDPRFSEFSFGFRPNRDRRHALKAALDYLNQGQRCWVVADLKDAFDSIPINRLMDIALKRFPGIDNTLISSLNASSVAGKDGASARAIHYLRSS